MVRPEGYWVPYTVWHLTTLPFAPAQAVRQKGRVTKKDLLSHVIPHITQASALVLMISEPLYYREMI